MQVFPLGKRTISVIVVIVALVLLLIYVVLRTKAICPCQRHPHASQISIHST
jgi:HlyD family secretion protein